MWERGLKSKGYGIYPNDGESLPMWERGLKLDMGIGRNKLFEVAPYVGAWIEISLRQGTLR